MRPSSHRVPDKALRYSAGESGNVFLFILIGIALFAALSLTVARSMQSQVGGTMSVRQARLAALDIIGYAQTIDRAVSRLRRKGISENDISFVNDIENGYAHTPVQADSNKVFHSSGGGITWQSAAEDVNDGSAWVVTGDTCVLGVGTGTTTGCTTDNVSNEELLIVLPDLQQIVCEQINDLLDISGIPTDGASDYSTNKFVGLFEDDVYINLGGAEYDAVCFEDSGGNYHFYHILLER